MRSIKLLVFISLAGMLILLSCAKEYSFERSDEKNKPPIAVAGRDTVLVLPADSITLNGRASTDPEGAPLMFLWTSIAGPALYTIADSTSAIILVKGLVKGSYQFELKVTDTGGLIAKDTITITIDSIPTTNETCGLPQTLIGSLSMKRQDVDILSAGNKIVFAAGYDDVVTAPIAVPFSRVDIYDRSNKNWSTAELSLARFAMGTVALGNKIYFAGGIKDYLPQSRVDIYDASSNTWSTAELSEPRYQVVAAAAGNRVLFAGGGFNQDDVPSTVVDIYDQSTGTWSTATLSHPTAGLYNLKYHPERSGVITLGNKIYFMLRNNTVDVYDVEANTWATLTGNANPLWNNTPVSIGNSIYFPGMSNGGFSNTLEIYTGNSWTTIDMLQPRSGMVAVAADNKIFWAGGNDSCCMLKDIEIYDLSTGHSLHQLQQAAWWLDALKTDSKVIFSYLAVSDIYDINTHTWSTCNKSFALSIYVENTIYRVEENSQIWKMELD